MLVLRVAAVSATTRVVHRCTRALVSPYPCLRGYAYAGNNIRDAKGWQWDKYVSLLLWGEGGVDGEASVVARYGPAGHHRTLVSGSRSGETKAGENQYSKPRPSLK